MNKIKMRRLSKKINSNKTRILSIILVSLFFTLSLGYSLFNQDISLGGTTIIDDVITANGTCNLNVTGTMTVNSVWNGSDGKTNETVDIIVNNEGTEDIGEWMLEIKGPEDLSANTYSNYGIEYQGTRLVLKSGVNNGLVKANGNIRISFTLISGASNIDIEYVRFNGCLIIGEEDPEDDDLLSLKDIILTPLETTIKVGETIKLSAVKVPRTALGELVFRSSDEMIATVDNTGTVMALREGLVTISVSSMGITHSCQVNVISPNSQTGNDISIVFRVGSHYSDYEKVIQFSITVKNNGNNELNSLVFTLGMPEGATYTLWDASGSTVTGNTFRISRRNWDGSVNTIKPNEEITITGSIKIPNNYSVYDYLNPSVSIVEGN